MMDLLLFGIFPYVALAVAICGSIYRYLLDRFSWSAQSSQFLENKLLFWGSVPWHFAILSVLAAHLLAFLFPGPWGELLGVPLRLYYLEVTGIALGIVTVLAVGVLIYRRMSDPKLAVVSSPMDWAVLGLLLVQVATGVVIALSLRWGSLWYLHTATPWLWSLLKFDPQVQYVAALPWIAKIHALNAFALVAIFPFSRLVHVVSVPMAYLWRPAQIVLWNRRPGA